LDILRNPWGGRTARAEFISGINLFYAKKKKKQMRKTVKRGGKNKIVWVGRINLHNDIN